MPANILLIETVRDKIYLIRGQKVMIDRDLAELYGVETKYLNLQVRRNIGRFPGEFMFQLNIEEKHELVTICHRFESMKHSSALPYVFTEHGVAMLSSILRSERAIKINILIIKTFIQLREYMAAHRELACKLQELEEKIGEHDEDIKSIVAVIKRLIREPVKKKEPIGFRPITGR